MVATVLRRNRRTRKIERAVIVEMITATFHNGAPLLSGVRSSDGPNSFALDFRYQQQRIPDLLASCAAGSRAINRLPESSRNLRFVLCAQL